MNGKNEISMLKLADVIPTTDNPRHVEKNDPKVKELAESIKKSGLLCPVICRPHPKQKGKYDLRAGFRRYLAHKANGSTEIMAIVRDMDDVTAMEVTVLENLQRESLTPLEEARGVDSLLKAGRDPKEIAAEIGKSVVWVYRRAKLVDLIPELAKAYEDPKSGWHRATAGHLEVIARLPVERQKKIFQSNSWNVENWLNDSAGEFAKDLAEGEMLIRSAPWQENDVTLQDDKQVEMIVCSSCSARSDRTPELFMDDTSPTAIKKNARCLNPDCWREKNNAYLKRREAELRQKHGDNLVIVGNYNYAVKDAPIRRTYDEWSVEKCKEKTPGARPALILGDGVPKEGWVKVKPIARAETVSSYPPSMEMRRKAWVIKYVEKALMAKDADCPFSTLKSAAAFIVEFGTQGGARYTGDVTVWKRYETLCNTEAGDGAIIDALWEKVRPILKQRLRYLTVGECNSQYKDAIEQGALLGLGDETALMKLAESALPGKQVPAKKTKPDKTVTKPAAESGEDKPCAKCGHSKSEHVFDGTGACTHWIHVNGIKDSCACMAFAAQTKTKKQKTP